MTFALRGASAPCCPSRPRVGVGGGCLRARRREALGAAVARPTRPFHATPHCRATAS